MEVASIRVAKSWWSGKNSSFQRPIKDPRKRLVQPTSRQGWWWEVEALHSRGGLARIRAQDGWSGRVGQVLPELPPDRPHVKAENSNMKSFQSYRKQRNQI